MAIQFLSNLDSTRRCSIIIWRRKWVSFSRRQNEPWTFLLLGGLRAGLGEACAGSWQNLAELKGRGSSTHLDRPESLVFPSHLHVIQIIHDNPAFSADFKHLQSSSSTCGQHRLAQVFSWISTSSQARRDVSTADLKFRFLKLGSSTRLQGGCTLQVNFAC